MIQLDEKLTFGKHKGKVLSDVIKQDPQWVLWIRNERLKQGEDFMSIGADQLLKKHAGGTLQRAGAVVDKSTSKLEKAMARQAAIEQENERRAIVMAESGWGEW